MNNCVRDMRMVSVPMYVIEAVRAEVRLELHIWIEMEARVKESLDPAPKFIPAPLSRYHNSRKSGGVQLSLPLIV